ncbi:hypothetical protein LP52_01675 [Streptomonospora alba]|uniref:Transcriptional regulator LacI/GalR-like sensor domain-containing protein n=1 Tax=Streptomonospora alba TaxID=183763 RepID=A0A0C2JGF8_9ACTN|nr:hypothetical protein LP52_01675 [Streptomonospora alba]
MSGGGAGASAYRSPTVDDLGALASAARGGASRVPCGSTRGSEHTRGGVRRSGRKPGCVPKKAARTPAGGDSPTVALVLSEVPGRRFEQPYFGRVLSGASSATQAAQARLTLTVTQSTTSREEVAERLCEQHVDGVLLFSLLPGDPLPALLERAGVPVVFGGRPSTPKTRTSYVDADNRGGGHSATDYLISQGRRRIATIAGPPRSPVGGDRLAGYRRALDGRPELVSFGDFSESSGVLAMRRLLDEQANLDSVFAASDNMALGALRELEHQGRRVPEDVAVIGFEDAGLAFGQLTLTTVHQPTQTMGQRMLEILVSRIDGKDDTPTEAVFDTRLVFRQSA